MILPTRKLLLLLSLPALGLLVAPHPITVRIAVAYDAVLLLIALIDLLFSARPSAIGIERKLPSHLSLDARNRIGWELHNRSAGLLRFEITDDVPEELERDVARVGGQILPRTRAELHYQVRPKQRGLYRFEDIHFRYWTPLGLLIRQLRIRDPRDVKVYPNVANLSRYELAAQRHRLDQLGLIAAHRRGQGTQFEGLREYVPGDDLGDVAWKATARHGHLITRTYETDRSQNVLVVIDCGRLMTTQVDRLSRVDYAINAALMLTYVAIKQGDFIGMLAFSDRIESYVPPLRGRAALGRINEALYRIEPRLRESSYEQACQFLALRHRKRSLIIVLTDVIDTTASAPLLAHMAHFARRHLPLCVTLRNLEVERLAAMRPLEAGDCFTKTAAVELLARRNEALGRMRSTGVDILDVDPRALTPRLLNHYLELKRRQRL